jgi:hypothetical protein
MNYDYENKGRAMPQNIQATEPRARTAASVLANVIALSQIIRPNESADSPPLEHEGEASSALDVAEAANMTTNQDADAASGEYGRDDAVSPSDVGDDDYEFTSVGRTVPNENSDADTAGEHDQRATEDRPEAEHHSKGPVGDVANPTEPAENENFVSGVSAADKQHLPADAGNTVIAADDVNPPAKDLALLVNDRAEYARRCGEHMRAGPAIPRALTLNEISLEDLEFIQKNHRGKVLAALKEFFGVELQRKAAFSEHLFRRRRAENTRTSPTAYNIAGTVGED